MALQRQRAAAAASEEAVRITLLLVPNTMHTSVFLLECAACERLGVQCSTELTTTSSSQRPWRAHFLCELSHQRLHGLSVQGCQRKRMDEDAQRFDSP